MRSAVVTCAVVLLGLTTPSAQEAPVKYFPASDMAALFAKGGTVTSGSNYKIMAAQRTGGGEAELHEHDTDVFRIMSGSATFVTGGRVTGPHTIEAGGTGGGGDGG